MTEAPKDPLAFNFGLDFQSAGQRIKGEREEREALVKRELKYHHSFLDDQIRGILPHDLILLGAGSGAGKTELARTIAMWNVRAGKTVHYFALEAEPKEIERRIKFALLAEIAQRNQVPSRDELNYPDWYRGRCEHIVGNFNTEAERSMALMLGRLKTYYKGSHFGHDDIRRLLLAIQSETDLIVLDHLHYVDIDDENENRGFKVTLKMLRDVTLGIGRPMILVVHLKKRDGRSRSIVPDIEQVHGSSDIFKIATHCIMIAPAHAVQTREAGVSNTFIHVPKDRMGGATGLIALCRFDHRFRSYRTNYTLGRQHNDGFEPLDVNEVPRWAKNHRPMYGGTP